MLPTATMRPFIATAMSRPAAPSSFDPPHGMGGHEVGARVHVCPFAGAGKISTDPRPPPTGTRRPIRSWCGPMRKMRCGSVGALSRRAAGCAHGPAPFFALEVGRREAEDLEGVALEDPERPAPVGTVGLNAEWPSIFTFGFDVQDVEDRRQDVDRLDVGVVHPPLLLPRGLDEEGDRGDLAVVSRDPAGVGRASP